jgi:hypothetical protein
MSTMSLEPKDRAARRAQPPAAALAALTMMLAALAIPAPAAAQCDRACLVEIAGEYMTALAAQDGSSLPWAERVRFTENDVALMVGDGLWATVSRVHEPQLVLADPETGNVLWYGVVEEHGDAAYLMARIKVEAERIAEVETVVSREGTPAHFAHPDGYRIDAVYRSPLPETERRPRERMIALVEGYYNTKQLNDGVLLTELAADCTRVSNGVTTTHGESTPVEGCRAQFEIGLHRPVDRVRARRFPLVDVEHGIVAAFAYLDHAARYVEYQTLDGGTQRIPVEYPNSHRVVELFKVRGGAVERVEGIAVFQLYLMPALWMR